MNQNGIFVKSSQKLKLIDYCEFNIIPTLHLSILTRNKINENMNRSLSGSVHMVISTYIM